MKINKTRPKFHILTKKKKRNKNNSPCVFVLYLTVSSLLEPFGGRFIDDLDFELYTLNDITTETSCCADVSQTENKNFRINQSINRRIVVVVVGSIPAFSPGHFPC